MHVDKMNWKRNRREFFRQERLFSSLYGSVSKDPMGCPSHREAKLPAAASGFSSDGPPDPQSGGLPSALDKAMKEN